MEGGGRVGRIRGVTRRGFLGGIVAAGSGSLAGCLVHGRASEYSGRIVMDGSNTVLPHGSAVAEEFMWRNNRVSIPVRGSGTGAGFQRFCAGETSFQNASREILPDEEERCITSDIEWLELGALLDGIAIWVHPDNTWCDCLTVEELSQIWRRDSSIHRWSDLNADWPDQDIDLYGRDSASGTFDYFTNAINGEYGNIRRDYSGTPDTNVIVRGVRGNRFAMGFGGAGYYFENEDDLKLVAIDDGDGCVLPSRETIEDGSYSPLSRPMFVYINVEHLARPEVQRLAEFYFEEVDSDGYALGRELGFIETNERLSWTQWAARRVGFYAIDNETVERYRDTLRTAIAEVA